MPVYVVCKVINDAFIAVFLNKASAHEYVLGLPGRYNRYEIVETVAKA